MKNVLKIMVFAFAAVSTVMAQDHTIAMSSGKLSIEEVAKVTIEGHAGANVIISREGDSHELPERAKGLKMLSASGLTDNTGLGLNVQKDGDVTRVKRVGNKTGKRYIIKVPRSVSVFYEHSHHDGGKLMVTDLESELEVSVNYNSVHLENVSGPMAVNTVYGSIDAIFSSVNQNNSITLYSVYSHVDVSVPTNAKANFQLSTTYGDMFSDLDLDFGTSEDDMKKLNANNMVGKLNGGGVDFVIKSSYSDIFLRNKS